MGTPLCKCTINTDCTREYEKRQVLCRRNMNVDEWYCEPKGSRMLLEPLLAERGKEYGDFRGMCATIQAIKGAIFSQRGIPGFDLDPMQVEALEMISTKIGRIVTGNPNNVDSWRDIAGYATLVADRIPKNEGPPDGTMTEIPAGWRLSFNNDKPDMWLGPEGRHFTGLLEHLRKHLGLDK